MFGSSCHSSPCSSFAGLTLWGNYFCTSSTSCSVTSANTAGYLLIVSGSCPSSLPTKPFSDTLGDSYTMVVNPSISGEQVGMAYSVLTSSGSNSITISCNGTGTIGIEWEEVSGLGTSFDVLTSTGTCTSGCTKSMSTASSVTIPLGADYFAVGVEYASPGSSTSTPGSGFTFNDPLYNQFQAAEYSASAGSSTNFPMTDGATPTQWIDGGAVFVANEAFSNQFNVEFPSLNGGFFSQSMMEFDLATNYCYANVNNNHLVPFTCSQADQSSDYFEWTISSTSNYFTSTSLYLDGSLLYTWSSQTAFGCSSCASMTDTYAQSVWVGWGTTAAQDGTFATFYDGQGTMQYSGMSLFNCYPNPGCGLIVTGESSNNIFSSPTYSSGLYSQTYYAATVGQVLNSYSTMLSGQILNPSYQLGIPDGKSAEFIGSTSGSGASTSDSLGGTPSSYSGQLAVYGYSYNANSEVSVYCGTSLVYNGDWSSSSTNQPVWIHIGEVSSCPTVIIYAVDQGSPVNIYVDALSLYNG